MVSSLNFYLLRVMRKSVSEIRGVGCVVKYQVNTVGGGVV